MSDKQTMPDHADLIKRLHNFLDYGPHPKTHNQCVAEAVTAIATLTAERDALVDAIDAFNHIDRSGRRDIVDLEQLNDAVERCLRLVNE